MKNRAPIATIRLWRYRPLEDVLTLLTGAFERCGDTLRVITFGHELYCSRNPEYCRLILTRKGVGSFKCPDLLPRVKTVFGNGGYILEGDEHWRAKRTAVQPAFTSAASYLPYVSQALNSMFERWEAASVTSGTTDIFREMRTLVTDFSFRAFFGRQLHYEDLVQAQEQTHFIEQHFADRIPLWMPTWSTRRFIREHGRLRTLILDCVRQQRTNAEAPGNLLSFLWNSLPEKPVTTDDVLGEAMSVYFGASVMATTLTWAFVLLGRNPHVTETLLNKASDGPQQDYLAIVLEEILRLYPASWGFPRVVRGADLELGQHTIPEGSIVIPMAWHVQRDPRLWPDPDAFIPERFSPQSASSKHPYAHFPFGAGPRMCLGAKIAPPIMKQILLSILLKYEVIMNPRFEGDPLPAFGFEIHPKDIVRASLRKRL